MTMRVPWADSRVAYLTGEHGGCPTRKKWREVDDKADPRHRQECRYCADSVRNDVSFLGGWGR
jgi:hypothetical protein